MISIEVRVKESGRLVTTGRTFTMWGAYRFAARHATGLRFVRVLFTRGGRSRVKAWL